MNDLIIVFKAILIVLKNFFLAAIFLIFGLTYIYLDEKRDKHKK